MSIIIVLLMCANVSRKHLRSARLRIMSHTQIFCKTYGRPYDGSVHLFFTIQMLKSLQSCKDEETVNKKRLHLDGDLVHHLNLISCPFSHLQPIMKIRKVDVDTVFAIKFTPLVTFKNRNPRLDFARKHFKKASLVLGSFFGQMKPKLTCIE